MKKFKPNSCVVFIYFILELMIPLTIFLPIIMLTIGGKVFSVGTVVGSTVDFFCSIVLMIVLIEFISNLVTASVEEGLVLLDDDSITYDNTCIKYEDVSMIEIDSGMMSKYGWSEPCYLSIFSDKDNDMLISSPSFILTLLLIKRCRKAKISYIRIKRVIFIAALMLVFVVVFLTMDKYK